MTLRCVAFAFVLGSHSFASASCIGDRNASCATLSCGFCGKNVGGCLSKSCDADDFDTELTDCSGGQCHYHCRCKNPTPTPPAPPTPTPPAPPAPPAPPTPTPPPPPAPPSKNHHIHIYGDSWGQFAATDGALPSMLKRHNAVATTVSSTAVSGSTACEWAAKPNSLADDVTRTGADLVWLTIGGNDMLSPARLACLAARCPPSVPVCPCDRDTYIPKTLDCAYKVLDPLFEQHPNVKVMNFFYDIPCLSGTCSTDFSGPNCGRNKTCVVEGQKVWQHLYSETMAAKYPGKVFSINLLGTAQKAGGIAGADIGKPAHVGSPCDLINVLCEHPSHKGWVAETDAMWDLFFSNYLSQRSSNASDSLVV